LYLNTASLAVTTIGPIFLRPSTVEGHHVTVAGVAQGLD
jgi:hypothetical protein